MYRFTTLIKVNEVIFNENNEHGYEHTGRWAFLINTITMPFVPQPGMSIRFNSESPNHSIVDVVYDQEEQTVELLLDMLVETPETYDDVINQLIELEDWEVLERHELETEEVAGAHGDVGNN